MTAYLRRLTQRCFECCRAWKLNCTSREFSALLWTIFNYVTISKKLSSRIGRNFNGFFEGTVKLLQLYDLNSEHCLLLTKQNKNSGLVWESYSFSTWEVSENISFTTNSCIVRLEDGENYVLQRYWLYIVVEVVWWHSKSAQELFSC
jgi:hypothetical protein